MFQEILEDENLVNSNGKVEVEKSPVANVRPVIEYNVHSIDRGQMRLGDTMAQTKYRTATRRVASIEKVISTLESDLDMARQGASSTKGILKNGEISPEDRQFASNTLSEQQKNLSDIELILDRKIGESIELADAQIEAFNGVVAIIDRVAHVTDRDGNPVRGADMPSSVVEIIMERMSEQAQEMSDPNG